MHKLQALTFLKTDDALQQNLSLLRLFVRKLEILTGDLSVAEAVGLCQERCCLLVPLHLFTLQADHCGRHHCVSNGEKPQRGTVAATGQHANSLPQGPAYL